MMMQKFLLLMLFAFVSPFFCFSQGGRQLTVQGTGSQLYLSHTVRSGENFYSVSRMYNVPPRDLASYNNLTMDKGLLSGQTIRIPLSTSNFTQSLTRSAGEALVPVRHTIGAGETLFRIGNNYGNVPLENLKIWNNMSGDNVNAGVSFIIGFLRVNKSESSLAGMDFKPDASAPAVVAAPPKADNSTLPQTSSSKNESLAPDPKSATGAPVYTGNGSTSDRPQPTTPVVATTASSVPGSKAGYFSNDFEGSSSGAQLVSRSGLAAVFKSTSGWQDQKYYCFNNDAEPGSIIKVYNGDQSKFVFAKVLDAIPDIKQNEGLTLVLSNAAADALGVNGEEFNATIQFFR